jgi:CheY-like chemotaxis protein
VEHSHRITDKTFLYVEDDPLSCEVMRMIMENGLGVQTLTIFQSSANFLQALKALPAPPDVLLLDIHVQPHDGFAMLTMVRDDSAFQPTRIIALTASVMPDEIAAIRAAGFDGVIIKPLSLHTFPDLILRVVNGESVWDTV